MSLVYSGLLKGHRNWVTALVCPQGDSPIKVVTASRDCTMVAWRAAERHSIEDASAVPEKRLEGHSNFVSDVAISNNGDYAVSSSWDGSLRLWNLKTGETMRKFKGHTKEVFSVAFSPDNRLIVSGGRDGKINVWNINGECMYTIDKDAHTDWVSCVRFSPAANMSLVVSGSWDNTVKVWSLGDYKCVFTLKGHTAHVSSVTISPDGSLCASASKDGKIKLWDLSRGEHLYELNCDEPVNQICFSPNRYWLCAATETRIRIYDLENKSLEGELIPEVPEGIKSKPQCVSLCWSADGTTLYGGYSDNLVRLYKVQE